MKIKLPENPPRPPDGYYWDDKDGDINLREEGKSPDNLDELAGWVDDNMGEEAGAYVVRRCLDEDPRNWPTIYTDSLEEAMNWLVAAVILDIRKEPE